MSNNAIDSQGMVLQRHDGLGPGAFVTIPEIINFGGPSGSAPVVDASDLSSTAVEKRMGLKDEGQITFSLHYIPGNTQHEALRADRTGKVLSDYQLVFADEDETTWAFSAYCTGFSISAGINNTLQAQVTLEITGAITEAA